MVSHTHCIDTDIWSRGNVGYQRSNERSDGGQEWELAGAKLVGACERKFGMCSGGKGVCASHRVARRRIEKLRQAVVSEAWQVVQDPLPLLRHAIICTSVRIWQSWHKSAGAFLVQVERSR